MRLSHSHAESINTNTSAGVSRESGRLRCDHLHVNWIERGESGYYSVKYPVTPQKQVALGQRAAVITTKYPLWRGHPSSIGFELLGEQGGIISIIWFETGAGIPVKNPPDTEEYREAPA